MKKVVPFARYDATLDTDVCTPRVNADLTLTLKLGFRQINPANGATTGTYNDYGSANGTPRKIVPWDVVSWTAWKQNFCISAERFWDRKFWLLNGSGVFPFRNPNGTFIPNFDCRLSIIGSDVEVGLHHHSIDVVRLDPSENWFGSNAALYDNLDLKPVVKSFDSNHRPIVQQAHVHEVGHLLGLGHVDIGKAHCPATGDTAAKDCYGVTDYDKNSVMGAGMQLRVDHAAPWSTALTRFVREERPSTIYKPTAQFMKPIVPYMQAQYPRTVQEFESGTTNINLPVGR